MSKELYLSLSGLYFITKGDSLLHIHDTMVFIDPWTLHVGTPSFTTFQNVEDGFYFCLPHTDFPLNDL